MVVIGSTGILQHGPWRWARSLGWMAVLSVLLVFVFNLVAKLVLFAAGVETGDGGDPLILLGAAVAGSLMVPILYGVAVRVGEQRQVSELALRALPRDLAVGFVVGGGLLAVVVSIQWAMGWVVIDPRPIDSIALALRDSIRSGVLEETVLRLVIFRLLWRAFGIWPAIAGAALIFGLLHLGNPDSSLFAAACLISGEGIGIGLYLLTGRIWSSIAMHSAWNFTQGWIFGATVSGLNVIAGGPLTLRPVAGVDPLLSGGGFGPEASVAALAVSVVASAAILHLAWRRGDFRACDSLASAPGQVNLRNHAADASAAH